MKLAMLVINSAAAAQELAKMAALSALEILAA